MAPVPILLLISFVALFILTAMVLILIINKALDKPLTGNQKIPIVIFFIYLAISSVLAITGFMQNNNVLPPRFLLVFMPALLFSIYFAFFYNPFRAMSSKYLPLILSISFFRFPLELLFDWLYHKDLLPVQMTFEGRNFDLLAGITAPIVAYLSLYKTILPKSILLVWNVVCTGLLLNIVTIAVLSIPSPIQYFTNEPANRIVTHFPFQFIPTFFVPLALFTHLFTFQKVFSKKTNITKTGPT